MNDIGQWLSMLYLWGVMFISSIMLVNLLVAMYSATCAPPPTPSELASGLLVSSEANLCLPRKQASHTLRTVYAR